MVKRAIEKTASENRDSFSKYRGVRKRNWGKWVSEIRLPNSRDRIWLGSYDSAEKAARAFDAALFCLRGGDAKFNFPENPPEIAGGREMSHSEIREAAARFANSQIKTEVSGRPGSESPSASVISDVTTASFSIDNEPVLDQSFLDSFLSADPGSFGSDIGFFPGFDDLSSDFLQAPPPSFDFGEEAAARFANSTVTTDESSGRPGTGFRPESPSTSMISYVSTASFSLDNEPAIHDLFLGSLLTVDPGSFGSDFGLFPGFDDLSCDFLPEPSPNFDFAHENFDGDLSQDSFLWSF